MSHIKPSKVDITVPVAQARRFERQLRHLIDQLAGSEGFKGRYLREEIFSKYLDETLVSAEERRDTAKVKWLSAESKNAGTNVRLYSGSSSLDGNPTWHWVTHERLLSSIQREVSRILGPLLYPSVLQQSVHTNGASTRVKRSPASRVRKYTGEVHISSSALCHWFAAFSGTRMSCQPLQITEESVFFTVPKKTEIDRVACKEPEGNMLLQRSVGKYIASRLRRFGIDLSDQTRNQELARDALRLGLATVDLSSASDTISRQLVLQLLPFDWWSLLDDLRVKSTRIGDTSHELEMFSSMGNGFTFELESLIFYAITKVVTRLSGSKGRVSVYGDDIICPCDVIPRLVNVFRWFGFTTNLKKTHSTGLFRESCGAHYWNGFDVSPFYLRKEVSILPDMINILNRLLEWDGRGWGFFVNKEAYLFWQRWAKTIPPYLWGGISPDDNSCLVTGHSPRKRLSWKTRAIRTDEVARLATWLHLKEHGGDSADLRRENHITVDPRYEIEAVVLPVQSRGELSSWRPSLAHPGVGELVFN